MKLQHASKSSLIQPVSHVMGCRENSFSGGHLAQSTVVLKPDVPRRVLDVVREEVAAAEEYTQKGCSQYSQQIAEAVAGRQAQKSTWQNWNYSWNSDRRKQSGRR